MLKKDILEIIADYVIDFIIAFAKALYFRLLTIEYIILGQEYYEQYGRKTMKGCPWTFYCILEDWFYQKEGGYAKRVELEYKQEFERPRILPWGILKKINEIPPLKKKEL